MLWRGREGSSNVEDRRGMGGGAAVGGVGAVIIGIIYFLLGGDPSQAPQIASPGQSREISSEDQASEDTLSKFVGVVLKDTEDIWGNLLNNYTDPKLVMFRDGVQSGCGGASSAVGPFYCPADEKVYIDLGFFKEMRERFRAAGDFAMAYVVAHEVGHHVQNILGTSEKVDRLRRSASEVEANKLSVKLELQADFYAGVWAHYENQQKHSLQAGDIEEALNAANAIGDDHLQQEAQGRIVPDAFTHGTSAQRMYWFKKGYETGDIKQGNTFDEVD